MDDMIEWFGETERQIADAEPLTSDLDRLRDQQRDHKVFLFFFNTILYSMHHVVYFSVIQCLFQCRVYSVNNR